MNNRNIAVGYVRPAIKLLDIESQKGLLIEVALKQNITLSRIYEEVAKGSKSDNQEKAIYTLLIDAEKKLFDKVFFYSMSQAFPGLEGKLFILNRLKKFGIKYESLLDPEENDADSETKFLETIGVINQYERQLIGLRNYENNYKIAKQGLWACGSPPLGYTYLKQEKRLIINPVEAELVRNIFAIYIETKSAQKTLDRLSYNSINPKTGRKVSQSTILDILSNEHYIGKITYGRKRKSAPEQKSQQRNHEYKIFNGQHEAIIDEDTFMKAQEIRTKNKRGQGSNTNTDYLLTGLIECAHCGAKLCGLPRSGKQANNDPMYKCPTRSRKGISACPGWQRTTRFIDEEVLAALFRNIELANLDVQCYLPNPKGEGETKPGLKLPSKLNMEEQKSLISHFITKIVTDGLDAKIFFVDLNKSGWNNAMAVQIPESYRFKRKIT